MKIIPVYENQVFVVPQDKVCRRLSTATREELAVLLSVLADPVFTPSDRAAALNLTEKTFLDALAEWQRCGVLAIAEVGDAPAIAVSETNPAEAAEGRITDKKPVKKAVHARRELPHYATADAAVPVWHALLFSPASYP